MQRGRVAGLLFTCYAILELKRKGNAQTATNISDFLRLHRISNDSTRQVRRYIKTLEELEVIWSNNKKKGKRRTQYGIDVFKFPATLYENTYSESSELRDKQTFVDLNLMKYEEGELVLDAHQLIDALHEEGEDFSKVVKMTMDMFSKDGKPLSEYIDDIDTFIDEELHEKPIPSSKNDINPLELLHIVLFLKQAFSQHRY